MSTVTEDVIAAIRERILDGKFAPGAHLHEAALATEFGVSRTPIRDALRILGNEDLLIYHPNRGYFVRAVELADVLDSYDVRGALEGLACRTAAENGLSDAHVDGFKTLLVRGDEIFLSPDWGAAEQARWRELNAEFHLLLLDAAHNRHLGPIMRQIRFFPRIFDSRLEPTSDFFQEVHTRNQRLRSHHDHIHIVDAMIRREGTRAEALMREHVYANRELLRQGIEAAKQKEEAGQANGA
jgi:GntR family transcriptional regulator of vanillate catabolism